jgi:glucose dehydrogenase
MGRSAFTEPKKGIPITGTESYGGPFVTAGGLVFIAGTRDERIRALIKKPAKWFGSTSFLPVDLLLP